MHTHSCCSSLWEVRMKMRYLACAALAGSREVCGMARSRAVEVIPTPGQAVGLASLGIELGDVDCLGTLADEPGKLLLVRADTLDEFRRDARLRLEAQLSIIGQPQLDAYSRQLLEQQRGAHIVKSSWFHYLK